MLLSDTQIIELLELAKATAVEAGNLVHSYLTKTVAVQHKADAGSLNTAVLTEVDLKAEQLILQKLQASQKQYD